MVLVALITLLVGLCILLCVSVLEITLEEFLALLTVNPCHDAKSLQITRNFAVCRTIHIAKYYSLINEIWSAHVYRTSAVSLEKLTL